MPRTAPASVDAYLAAQPEPARAVLERVRGIVRKALPGATEAISYQIPMFAVDGAMVLYVAGFQRHWSIYPATERVVAALGPEVAGRVHAKATLRFSYDDVPARLVARFAKLRAAEAAERVKAKKAPRRAATGRATGVRAGRRRDGARRR